MVRKSKLSHHIIKNNALGYKNTELYVTTNIALHIKQNIHDDGYVKKYVCKNPRKRKLNTFK